MNPYLANILEQPEALRTAVTRFDGAVLGGMRAGNFDRIVLCGMGGSHFGTYPAWLTLTRAGLPVWHVEASELLHQALPLITRKTLLILTSQSGRSAEILALLDNAVPGQLLAVTNDPSSPLAECANAVLLMHAGDEGTVSTKTYLNTLAVTQLAARALAGKDVDRTRQELLAVADEAAVYLRDLASHKTRVGQIIGVPERAILLGRGASLATATAGALILKESAKLNAEGMSAGQFRHGPLELADSRLSLLIFRGEGAGQALNARLADDLGKYGARPHLIGADTPVAHPGAAGAGIPVAEMLVVQTLSLVVAEGTGFVPGQFRHSQKVTTLE